MGLLFPMLHKPMQCMLVRCTQPLPLSSAAHFVPHQQEIEHCPAFAAGWNAVKKTSSQAERKTYIRTGSRLALLLDLTSAQCLRSEAVDQLVDFAEGMGPVAPVKPATVPYQTTRSVMLPPNTALYSADAFLTEVNDEVCHQQASISAVLTYDTKGSQRSP